MGQPVAFLLISDPSVQALKEYRFSTATKTTAEPIQALTNENKNMNGIALVEYRVDLETPRIPNSKKTAFIINAWIR